ncbi:MAG: CPBP family intramembrane metalloprotease [Candidatus Aminicenantes bacterium]|nr:CPBP family intramembrane metalloprotease [Candidatus Aminicenantes bacterium]
MTSNSNLPVRSQSLLAASLAAVLLVPLFALRRIGGFDFWWWMSLNVLLLVSFGLYSDKSYLSLILKDLQDGLLKKIGLGILSAGLLYAVFFIGNEVSREIFPFAGTEIGQVYSFKQNASALRIMLLMIFIIGPGEELFWRGYLQRHWQNRFGKIKGFVIAAVLYALVHAASGNIMLVLSAGVCGLFWGFLYLRTRSILTICISHTLWDLMIFVFFTLGG